MRLVQVLDRVRRAGSRDVGTVVSVSHLSLHAMVAWDASPKWLVAIHVADLLVVTQEPVGVPPEARPISVGAMAGGGR